MVVQAGTRTKRLVQYKFRPHPFEVLDTEWEAANREWQFGVVERLQRGEPAPRALATGYDTLLPSGGPVYGPAGWEATEEYAKDADRTHAVYLSDDAIKMRMYDQRLRLLMR